MRLWAAFGQRRLRRQSQPDLVTSHRDTAGPTSSAGDRLAIYWLAAARLACQGARSMAYHTARAPL